VIDGPVVAPRAEGVHPRSATTPTGEWRVCVGTPTLLPALCITIYIACSPRGAPLPSRPSTGRLRPPQP
jgi:hypothetical protein